LGPTSDDSDIAVEDIKGLGEEASIALGANHRIRIAEMNQMPDALREVYHDSTDLIVGDLEYLLYAIDQLFSRL
jgi:hypothetical protein